MQIQLESGSQRFRIKGYSQSSIVVNEQTFSLPILLTPLQIITNNLPQSFQMMDVATLDKLLNIDVEVKLIGTGSTSAFLPIELESRCFAKGAMVDCMTTGAACRTFEIVSAEQRPVAALLF